MHSQRTGVTYRLGKSFAFQVGILNAASFSSGGNFKSPVINNEFRLWEQVTLLNNIGHVKIEHRYRIEQRWRNGGYLNRFRYRLNSVVPLNSKTIKDHSLFTSCFGEFFFSDRPSYFERNRFFVGLGFQFNTHLTLQAGWLRQTDFSGNNTSSKDFFQSTVFIRLKKQQEHLETHSFTAD